MSQKHEQFRTDFKTIPPQPFKRKCSKYYYYRMRIGGRDVWRCLYTTNKAEARRLTYDIWYWHQGKPLQDIFDEPLYSLDKVIKDFSHTDKYSEYKDSTRSDKEKIFKNFSLYCQEFKIRFVQELTESFIIQFLEGDEDNKRANKTFNNYKGDLAAIFDCTCRKYNFDNLFKKIPNRSIKKGERASQDIRAFTPDEITAIFDYLQTSNLKNKREWIAAAKIALYTGLRYKDIAMLQWTHIKDNTYIELKPEKTNTITGKSVIINIIPELFKLFSELPKWSFYILPNLGRSYNPESRHNTDPFNRIIKKQLKFPGKASFHSFRSTIVTEASKAGIELKDLGGVLGHTNPEQTEHYNKNAINIHLDFMSGKYQIA